MAQHSDPTQQRQTQHVPVSNHHSIIDTLQLAVPEPTPTPRELRHSLLIPALALESEHLLTAEEHDSHAPTQRQPQ